MTTTLAVVEPAEDRVAPADSPPHAVSPSRNGSLDGLRAVAVLAVLCYHLWPEEFTGGYLGVDLFMVLSGYLITGLLIDERARSGRIGLGAFWGRRARRILPAFVATVGVVAVWVAVAGPATLRPTVRGQGLFSLIGGTNWKLVADGTSYAAMSKPPSPLLHLWSLAVEQQFYVIWPPIVVMVLLLTDKHRRAALIGVAMLGIALSAGTMAILFDPQVDPLRLYYGSDTRAQTFLVGAIVAVVARHPRIADLGRKGRRGASVAGWLAILAVTWALVWQDRPEQLYRGGFLLFATLAGIVVLAAATTTSLGVLLDRSPLRILGRVSYGVYLWHWPAIVLISAETTALRGWSLNAARLAVTFGATALSWFLIERPFAHAGRRPSIGFGGAAVAVTTVAVLALPSSSLVPYAGVDVRSAPPPQVVTPSSSAVTRTTTSTPTSSSNPGSTLVPATPGTVMIVGDSGMYDETPALTAAFAASGWTVVNTAYPGIGLTHPGLHVRERWSATVAQHHPKLVVVMLGGWDIDFIAKEGDAAYTAVVDDTVRRLTRGGARILWLSMLPGGTTADRPPDRFYQALPARYPGTVDYLDIGPALQSPDGTWPRVLDGLLLRKPDNWHLCPAGAAKVAEAVVADLGITQGSWLDGAWRNDARYDDPHGGCDA